MKTLLCVSFFLSLTCTNSWEKNELSLSFSDSWEMKTLSPHIFHMRNENSSSLSLSHAHWFTKNKNSLLSLIYAHENSLSLSLNLSHLSHLHTGWHDKWKLSKLFTFQDVTIMHYGILFFISECVDPLPAEHQYETDGQT